MIFRRVTIKSQEIDSRGLSPKNSNLKPFYLSVVAALAFYWETR